MRVGKAASREGPGGPGGQVFRGLPGAAGRGLASRRSLTDGVTGALEALVRGRDYTPGSHLPTENELASHFGVSRTVVREAMARLKSAGLVESRQGSGVYVREPNARMLFRIDPERMGATADAVLPVVELRRGVEVEAAGLAAERRTARRLAGIRAALAGIARAEAAGRDGVAEDMAFHQAIVRATGNPHYLALWTFIGRFVREAMRTTRANEARRADFLAQVRAEHQAIVDAIARGDAGEARATARRHSEMSVARLRESGLLGKLGSRVGRRGPPRRRRAPAGTGAGGR